MKKSISKSSRLWLARQHQDVFVKKSKQEGYRSRAAYKLLELQAKYKVLRPGMNVVDLGAAPGSWSQVISEIIFVDNGKIDNKLLAVDILPIEPIKHVDIINGDFTDNLVFSKIVSVVNGEQANAAVRKVDLIVSDLSPNLSGIWAVDIPKSIYLCELAWELVFRLLRENGDFVLKMFNGAGVEQYLHELRTKFAKVIICKPKSSRVESREIYVIAKGYRLINE